MLLSGLNAWQYKVENARQPLVICAVSRYDTRVHTQMEEATIYARTMAWAQQAPQLVGQTGLAEPLLHLFH